MPLWKIALRSIQQRSLASTLTALSMALGVSLVVAVLVIHGIILNSFSTGAGLGYNLVVGAEKGGRLQLVLNTVYYLSAPVENVPWSFYKEFVSGKYKPYVSKAVPVCLGDYFGEYRVVGTTPAFFNAFDYGNGRKFTFSEGRNFLPKEYFCGVVGATVAETMNLKVGSEFHPSHGAGPEAHQHDPFKVVGVLERTGTPNDRALFVNIEGFYLLDNHAMEPEEGADDASSHEHDHDHAHDHEHDHEHESGDAKQSDQEHDHDEAHDHPKVDEQPKADAPSGDQERIKKMHDDHDHAHDHDHGHSLEPLPESQREVTAILVLTSGAIPELTSGELVKKINKGSVGQAVLPILEITNMFRLFVDPIQYLLLGLTVLIVVVAGIGILVSIYNSMSERRHEIAVMRALGAGRQTVMLIVLLESILLSLAGGVLGFVLGHLLIAAINPWISANTGVSVGPFHFVPLESVIIPGLIVLAAIVGYVPALAAYRTDVAKSLTASP